MHEIVKDKGRQIKGRRERERERERERQEKEVEEITGVNRREGS